jgi:CHASE3 domain sensor protein
VSYNIKVINSNFIDGSGVVINKTALSSDDREILYELKQLQGKLENVEPMISEKISELQVAIQNQDKPKITNIAKQLSSGFAASVLANAASPYILKFLGIS